MNAPCTKCGQAKPLPKCSGCGKSWPCDAVVAVAVRIAKRQGRDSRDVLIGLFGTDWLR